LINLPHSNQEDVVMR